VWQITGTATKEEAGMKKRWSIPIVCLLVGALAAVALAQSMSLPGYIREDLQLISQQSKPNWSPQWTGPIQGATILAWLHENGYPRLERDLNGDGVIDELDTIELADILGNGVMRTETPRGTTDARLVIGLAQYIADLYPNQFVIKIYDEGFPAEFVAEGLGPFAPDVIPGIQLQLMTEPAIEPYEYELQTGEAVIVGLETVEGENNTYLSGRSFLFEQTPEGYTPIDLAWAEEDRWQAGYQGQVLETVGWMQDRFLLEYRGAWTPVEFMLAISPLEEPASAGAPGPCPDNAVAFDVTENPTPNGRIVIEECVTRKEIDGVVLDTYTYTVRNIDFEHNGCGFCYFFVPDVGVTTTVQMTGPAMWMKNSSWMGWTWWAPLGSCGIQPGQVGVFSFTVVGPTFDTWLTGRIGECAPSPPLSVLVQLRSFDVRTTGPGEGMPEYGACCYRDGTCADTTLEDCNASGGTFQGVGTTCATVDCPGPVNPTGACCLPDGSCIETDSVDCRLQGGVFEGVGISCATVQCPTGEDCPDLTVEFTSIQCVYDARNYILTVEADVSNIGSMGATNVLVRFTSDIGNDNDLIGSLPSGDTESVTFVVSTSVNSPPPCPVDVKVVVDPYHGIDECNEKNNEDTGQSYCPNCK
jgi:hypothetical protein